MGCTGSVQLGPVYPSLNTPIIRQPEGGNHRGVGMGSTGSVQSKLVHPSLNTPLIVQPEGVRTRRALDLVSVGRMKR